MCWCRIPSSEGRKQDRTTITFAKLFKGYIYVCMHCLYIADPWTMQGQWSLWAAENSHISFGSPETLLIAYYWPEALPIT